MTKSGQLPTGLLQFEDDVPRGLGRPPRFTVHRFAGEWRREITYPMAGLMRGRFRTGPLTVRATDPFHLVKLDRRFSATSEVQITPRVVPLPMMRTASGGGSTGDTMPQKAGVIGADDVLVREYHTRATTYAQGGGPQPWPGLHRRGGLAGEGAVEPFPGGQAGKFDDRAGGGEPGQVPGLGQDRPATTHRCRSPGGQAEPVQRHFAIFHPIWSCHY